MTAERATLRSGKQASNSHAADSELPVANCKRRKAQLRDINPFPVSRTFQNGVADDLSPQAAFDVGLDRGTRF